MRWKTITAFFLFAFVGTAFLLLTFEVKKFNGHIHDDRYYIDTRVEQKLTFLLNALRYDLGDDNSMTTNEVVSEILNYLGLKVKYIPPKDIGAQVGLIPTFSEAEHRGGVN